MKRFPQKDLYAVLGVLSDATTKQMREAYIARTRVMHPDRFDQEQDPQDWKAANANLAELNEAYSILRNATRRKEYDIFRGGKEHRQPDSASPPPFQLEPFATGDVSFKSLPKQAQSRLLKRQENSGVEQFQLRLPSSSWGLFTFAASLGCCYILIVSAAAGEWDVRKIYLVGSIPFAMGLLLGRKCIQIRRSYLADIKPYFYVTPAYFVWTGFNTVSFRPLLSMTDFEVTHNHQNGVYESSTVVLKFDGYVETLNFSSEELYQEMQARMLSYFERLRSAAENKDRRYFLINDDFRGFSRSDQAKPTLPSTKEQRIIYGSSIFFFISVLIAALITNSGVSNKPSPPDQTAAESTLTSPAESTLTSPAESTLTSPPKRRHKLIYPNSPERLTSNSVVKPLYAVQTLPESGSVQSFLFRDFQVAPFEFKGNAPFEIKAASGSNYLVKLVDAQTFSPVLTVFVRSGTTVKVNVPLGTYEVRYAAGSTWYGYKHLFGPNTAYSRAEKTFTFASTRNQVRGFSITLYNVTNGNLRTATIKPAEF